MVATVRAEHRTAILRSLDPVRREENYFSNFTGRIDMGVFQRGCMSGPVEEVAKLEGGWNYLKLWSTLSFSYCLLRDRNFRPKRNRPITCRAVRLLVLFPHTIFDSMWKKERTYAREEEWVPGHQSRQQSIPFCLKAILHNNMEWWT